MRPGIVRLDVIKDGDVVLNCEGSPFDLYLALRAAFPRAALRRLAKYTSTSAWGTGGRGPSRACWTRLRNQRSYAAGSALSGKGSAPSFAVRVSRMRTASETVRPMVSRTSAARALTSGLIRVCTRAFSDIPHLILDCSSFALQLRREGGRF